MLKCAFVHVCEAMMALIYAIAKLAPVKKGKVLFLSRQSNEPSLDFRMLQKELSKRDEVTEMVVICQRVTKTVGGLFATIDAVIRSIGHLASSEVCVIDSYWPAVSMLHHRKELKVIQIWHALGKIKQSGLITAGRPGGRPVEMARAVHMHEGYDYIIAGAPAWNRYYCESFGCTEDKLVNLGLPRMDYIRDGTDVIRTRFFETYPQMIGKPVVVYAPTFRRDSSGHAAAVAVSKLQDESYSLIVKGHPNQLLDAQGMETCPDFTTVDLLAVADVLITDYSAVALEAAWAHVKTLYYLYDYEDYLARNGLNADPYYEMPSCAFATAQEVVDAARCALAGDYPIGEFERYRAKWLLPDSSRPTVALTDFICCML